jgi:hypothetical protein
MDQGAALPLPGLVHELVWMRLGNTPEKFGSDYWEVAEPKEVPRWATLVRDDPPHIRQFQRRQEELAKLA